VDAERTSCSEQVCRYSVQKLLKKDFPLILRLEMSSNEGERLFYVLF